MSKPRDPPAPVGEHRRPIQQRRADRGLACLEELRSDFAALAAGVRGKRPLPVSSEQELAVQEALLKASEML